MGAHEGLPTCACKKEGLGVHRRDPSRGRRVGGVVPWPCMGLAGPLAPQ